MKIGDRIKERRIELGYSVDELAEKLGKNRATVYRYESNEIENLPITTLEPLAKALNTTPAHLMGWGDESDTLTISTTSLGKRIKELRQKLSLTQEELANMVGYKDRTSIAKIETGIIADIPSDKIEALANELNTSPAYLMGWDEFEKSSASMYRFLSDMGYKLSYPVFEGEQLVCFTDNDENDVYFYPKDFDELIKQIKETIDFFYWKQSKNNHILNEECVKLNAAHELPNATEDGKARDNEKINKLLRDKK